MSTGSVNPFTPTQPTQSISVSATNQTIIFNQCDALLVYNAGTAAVFVTLGTTDDPPTATVAASMPIPNGTQTLIGVPGVVGVAAELITQIGIIAAGATGTVYVTPGMGTQH